MKINKKITKKRTDKRIKKSPERQARDKKKYGEYIYIPVVGHPFSSRGKYPLHRAVMERYLQRFLGPLEAVHHINGDKSDNRIDNLMLFPNNQAHMKFHTKLRQHGMTNPIRRQIENRWIDLKEKGEKI